MKNRIIWHRHHILPKHAGGGDEPANILKCNIAMHIFMHEQRYKETGDEYDRIAFQSLKGQLLTAHIASQVRRESTKRRWKSGKFNGVNNPRFNTTHSAESKKLISERAMGRPSAFKGRTHSAETKAKMSAARKGKEPWNKGKIMEKPND